jgi:hypothetical protein
MSHRLVAAAAAFFAFVAAGACCAVPSLADSRGSHPVTFTGQCQFAGTSSFSTPVTAIPAPVRNRVVASGPCSGSLTDSDGRATQLNNATVRYRAVESGSAESCAGDPDAVGTGELVFPHAKLRFSVVENRVGGQAALAYTGRTGGSATGVAYVTSSDPSALLEQCAETGMSSAPVAIVYQTTPSISG